MFRIIEVTDSKTRKIAEELRYDVFVNQERKFRKVRFSCNAIKSGYDDLSGTIIMLALHQKEPAATISAYAYDQSIALPIAETVKNVFDLRRFASERRFSSPLYSCGMLAIKKKFQAAPGLLPWLMRSTFILAENRGCQDVIATVNHLIEPMLSRIGFKRLLPEKWYSEVIDNSVFLMYAELPWIRDFMQRRESPEWCREFENSGELLVGRHEEFFSQGDPSKSLYYILEGSADVTLKTANSRYRLSTLYSGDTFGEMSLFRNSRRTATVSSNSLCVAKAVPRKSLWGLFESREKTLMLAKVLTQRLLNMNRSVKKGTPIISQPLFSVISKKHYDDLPKRRYGPGEIIASMGAQSDKAFIAKNGRFLVTVASDDGTENAVSIISGSGIFGHLGFFNSNVRTASVVSVEPATIGEIGEDLFWQIFGIKKNRVRLIRNLFETLYHMNINFSTDLSREKILYAFKQHLLRHYHCFGICGENSSLSADSVSEELKIEKGLVDELFCQFRKKGIIKQSGGKYLILKPELIESFRFAI